MKTSIDESKLRIYRFQHNRFYGGVATAFCGECNIECVYCYSQNQRNTGKFLSAEEIGARLIRLAEKNNTPFCRISGGDPFPKFDELFKVIEYVHQNSDKVFVVETNGIEIGRDENIPRRLAGLDTDRLLIRVCVKHIIPAKFALMTQMPTGDGCGETFQGLKWMREYNVTHVLAFMEDFYTTEESEELWAYCFNNGYATPEKGCFDDDDVFDEWLTRQDIDIENFRGYQSIKLKKAGIKKLMGVD